MHSANTQRALARAYGKFALVLAITIALALLVIFHVTGINGASYHRWGWTRIASLRILPGLLLAAAPFIAAQILKERSSISQRIGLLMLSMLLMQLMATGMQERPFNLWRIAEVVQQPYTTSYYTDGEYLATQRSFGNFLREYPSLMPFFNLHSQEKPPGPILYYYALFKIMSDPSTVAMIGGILIGVISTLSIPATYFYTRQVSSDHEAAFSAASYLSLCPSIIMLFPTFDICYPIMTCIILGAWLQALATTKARWAVVMGIALAVSLFMAFNLLVLGAGIVLIAVWQLKSKGLTTILHLAVVSLSTVVGIFLILYLTCGFNELATFNAAVANQQKLDSEMLYPRPYPNTIPSDLQDFLLASGWISLPLILFHLIRKHTHPMVWIGLAQIAIVAMSGLLRCETARVWIFLLPLVVLPVGLELSSWPRRVRNGVYACLWLLTVLIAQNMKFLLG